jgi:hypothetical protein
VPTGGVPTGGIAPTGGVPTGGVPTGGVPTGGIAPTGGVPTGGVPTGGVSGIDCNGETCDVGASCCLPWGTQGTYCSTPEWDEYCEPGASSQGLLAECTSPDDCPGLHCCVYYVRFGTNNMPSRSECGNCIDGQGAVWACETDADCGPGRVCRTNTLIYSGAIKTCK